METSTTAVRERMWCTAIYCAVAAFLAVYLLWVGVYPQLSFEWDMCVALDGGWRTSQGLRPFLDFYVLPGPSSFLMAALGILISDGRASSALPLMVVLPFVPVAVIIWKTLFSRYSARLALAMGLFLCFEWVLPLPVRMLFYMTSYGMSYTRFGQVLMGLVLAILMAPRNEKLRWSSGVWLGFLIGELFFLKISFAVVGAFLVAALWIRDGVRWRDFVWMALGAVIGGGPFVWYTTLEGMRLLFVDLAIGMRAREPALLWLSVNTVFIELIIPAILLVEVVRCQFTATHHRDPLYPGRLGRIVANPYYELLVVIAAATLADLGGFPRVQTIENVLLSVFAIVSLARLKSRGTVLFTDNRLAAMAALLVILPLANGVMALTLPLYERIAEQHGLLPQTQRVQSAWFDVPLQVSPGDPTAATIEAGIELIRKHPEIGDQSVGAVVFSDPFSFAFHRRTAKDLPLSFSIGSEISEKSHPPAELFFAHCNYLLVTGDQARMAKIVERIPEYGDYVKLHFEQVEGGDLWTLWKRKETVPGTRLK